MGLLLGESRQLNGAMTWRDRGPYQQALLPRDSRQSCRAGHNLFAAFSCGGFSLLDSGRVESPAARTPGFTASVALRDLRV